MGTLGRPPEEIGHKVAAALVGTFLAILRCYGLIGPIAANMTKAPDEEHAFLICNAGSDGLVYEGRRAHHGG
jgi:chemotaxis protein MotA